jgi:hypothetical protein
MFSHLPAARAVTTPFGELHVVSVVFNPLRFASRYYLLKDFKKHVQCSGAIVDVAEAAQGDRPWEVTTVEDLQWRVRDELWLKESMINAAVARLPDDWQYVAWVDADVTFLRPDWVQETIQQLQHHAVVQMFEYAVDPEPPYAVTNFRP